MHLAHRLLSTSLFFLLLAGCGDDGGDGGRDSGTPRRDSGGMMGTDSGGMMGTDSGGMMGTDSGGMMASGACINPTDEAWAMSHDTDMVVGDCAGGCFGGEECTRMCLTDTGMTTPCATCFGQVVACTAMRCAFMCFDADSPECAACRDSMGCTAAFEMCSGYMD